MVKYEDKHNFTAPVVIRRIFLSWLLAATIAYAALPSHFKALQTTAGIAQISFLCLCVLVVIFFSVFTLLGKYVKPSLERQLVLVVFTLLAFMSLLHNFSWRFFICCVVLWIVILVYAIWGCQQKDSLPQQTQVHSPVHFGITAIVAICFVLFVSIWTVCRIYSFCTPTFDFGIFSQMFYNMKTSGLPITTVERDGMLSHFHVHVSPIYYVLLPIYCLFPYPATLQVAQAIILASAVIPLYKIGKLHGLSHLACVALCSLLLVYPAYSGGTSYDIHENSFLTPLILWLLYSIDRRSAPSAIACACLTLLIKEDAAVYVAVIALYVLVKTALKKSLNQRWDFFAGIFMLLISVVWFLLVTSYLSNVGDGVMTYRYHNFMYDDSGSLFSVIKAVLMYPMKVLFESVDEEKLSFLFQTLFPLLGLPFFTRRYERYILLIPYVLINLMSDYRYQHDIFFQYTFGSTAFLFYLAVINLAEVSVGWKKLTICFTALTCSIFCFAGTVLPKAVRYPMYCLKYADHYESIRQTLDLIPADAAVSATTFYTTHLSQREVLYDIKYSSLEHLLETEYVALAINERTNYTQYAIDGEGGYENLCMLLEKYGYEVFASLDQTLVIYKKAV